MLRLTRIRFLACLLRHVFFHRRDGIIVEGVHVRLKPFPLICDRLEDQGIARPTNLNRCTIELESGR